MSDDEPLPGPRLDDLMPWSAAPLRLGRGWVMAPDAASLRARWETLVRRAGEAEREALFGPNPQPVPLVRPSVRQANRVHLKLV